MFAGVCNGIAAYLNWDPTIVRLIFVILTLLTTGIWILVYLVMMFVIPMADTPAEKSAAHGAAATTAQEFIRRARQGYYEGMKAMPDREARREWKRKFKRDMRAWAHGFQWEMQSGARRWQQQWQQCGAAYPGAAAGWALMLPLLTVVHAVLALACLVGLVSLLTTGAVWGIGLPIGIPLWGGVILYLIAYSLVVLPIKLARHTYRHQIAFGMHPGVGAFVHLWEALVWLTFLVVVVWLVHRHLPDVMSAIHAFPPLVRDAVHSIREWWSN
jgi:phage shock protein PspC (stress-responsive transcriptional regulator)